MIALLERGTRQRRGPPHRLSDAVLPPLAPSDTVGACPTLTQRGPSPALIHIQREKSGGPADGEGLGLELTRGMDHVLPPEEDTDVPGFCRARQLAGLAGIGLGDDWLRKVCWDNPVAMFGLPEAVGGG